MHWALQKEIWVLPQRTKPNSCCCFHNSVTFASPAPPRWWHRALTLCCDVIWWLRQLEEALLVCQTGLDKAEGVSNIKLCQEREEQPPSPSKTHAQLEVLSNAQRSLLKIFSNPFFLVKNLGTICKVFLLFLASPPPPSRWLIFNGRQIHGILQMNFRSAICGSVGFYTQILSQAFLGQQNIWAGPEKTSQEGEKSPLTHSCLTAAPSASKCFPSLQSCHKNHYEPQTDVTLKSNLMEGKKKKRRGGEYKIACGENNSRKTL